MSGPRGRRPAGTLDPTQALALRLAIAAALITLTLAIYARSLDLLRTDLPLSASNGRIFWLVTICSVTGFGYVVNRAAAAGYQPVPPQSARPAFAASGAGILPALAIFAAVQLVAWDNRAIVVVAAPLLAGAGVFTSVVVRHYLLSGDPAVYPGARLVHSALTSGVAFLSMSLTASWKAGPLYTSVVILVIAGLLVFQAFDGIRAFPVRRAAYALATAIVVAEAALALNYWPPAGWFGGAILAVVFVVLMLTVEAILMRRISNDIVVRYAGAGIGICGLFAILAR